MSLAQPDVLFVEDDASIRLATAQSLKLVGLSVLAVGTMEEAVSRVTGDFAGVVLTDVRLPGLSGMDLLSP
jgi:two-component system, NtrC family, C4-dicarboxylate transport response regulator DctD